MKTEISPKFVHALLLLSCLAIVVLAGLGTEPTVPHAHLDGSECDVDPSANHAERFMTREATDHWTLPASIPRDKAHRSTNDRDHPCNAWVCP